MISRKVKILSLVFVLAAASVVLIAAPSESSEGANLKIDGTAGHRWTDAPYSDYMFDLNDGDVLDITIGAGSPATIRTIRVNGNATIKGPGSLELLKNVNIGITNGSSVTISSLNMNGYVSIGQNGKLIGTGTCTISTTLLAGSIYGNYSVLMHENATIEVRSGAKLTVSGSGFNTIVSANISKANFNVVGTLDISSSSSHAGIFGEVMTIEKTGTGTLNYTGSGKAICCNVLNVKAGKITTQSTGDSNGYILMGKATSNSQINISTSATLDLGNNIRTNGAATLRIENLGTLIAKSVSQGPIIHTGTALTLLMGANATTTLTNGAATTHNYFFERVSTVSDTYYWNASGSAKKANTSDSVTQSPLLISFTNGSGTVKLSLGTPPSISAPLPLVLTVGYAATSTGSFTVTGTPAPTVSITYCEAWGVTWNAGKLDIAAGLPAGSYSMGLKASNGVSPDATTTYTIIVNSATGAPVIAPPAAMTLTAGYAATSTDIFTVTGTPAPTVTKESGDAKITWNNSTKKLDIATGLTAGSYSVVLKAANGVSPDATITYTVTVNSSGGAPTIAGPVTMTLTAGYAATSTEIFTVTGTPAPTVTRESGDAKITWNAAESKLNIAAGLTAGSYSVVLKAANGISPDATTTFTLTVNPPGSATVTNVTVNPSAPNVAKGSTQNFTATVTGTGSPAQTVTWSVTGGTTGTSITSGGVLTVAEGETASTLTVRATSTVDPSKSGTATVTVSPEKSTDDGGGGSNTMLYVAIVIVIVLAVLALVYFLFIKKKP